MQIWMFQNERSCVCTGHVKANITNHLSSSVPQACSMSQNVRKWRDVMSHLLLFDQFVNNYILNLFYLVGRAVDGVCEWTPSVWNSLICMFVPFIYLCYLHNVYVFSSLQVSRNRNRIIKCKIVLHSLRCKKIYIQSNQNLFSHLQHFSHLFCLHV